MSRLDTRKQERLEPRRGKYAKEKIEELGYHISMQTDKVLQFEFNGERVILFPYSGWHTGRSIKDGRGIDKLLKQIAQ